MTPRLPGCCPLCDERLYEVKSYFAGNHPFAGEPREVGNVSDDAIRCTFVLMSGQTADMVLCPGCADEVEGRLPELWRRVCLRFVKESEARPFLGGRPLTPEQAKIERETLIRTLNDLPLGVIARQLARDCK